MHDSATVLDRLVSALSAASAYNRNDQAAPAAVLWTDKEQQWKTLLPLLRARLPVLTLGEHDPAIPSGPAYWIRCVLAGAVLDCELKADETPIVYLPGVSRQELRAVEDCSPALQPIAELQYRGVFWNQRNGHDWTIGAFLQNRDTGLSVEMATDTATRDAAVRALVSLARQSVQGLKDEAPLRAAYFDELLHPDLTSSVLVWLDDPAGFRTEHSKAEWDAFCGLVTNTYGVRPERDGELVAAERLGKQTGGWGAVWQRFALTPGAYPHIPDLLRRAYPSQQPGLFDPAETWPQDNDAAETDLRSELARLREALPLDARVKVRALEERHGERRRWVWSQLGRAPLARALLHLADLARITEQPLQGATPTSVAEAYAKWGWRADDAVVRALEAVEQAADVAAVRAALQALYKGWLENSARVFQKAVLVDPTTYTSTPLANLADGTCVLFSDGLRFDIAERLAAELRTRQLTCETGWRFAALPTVTATAKTSLPPPSVSFKPGSDFDALTSTGSKVNADALRKTLVDAGWKIVPAESCGEPGGFGWSEQGDLDSLGHASGWRLVYHVEREVRSLANRIAELLAGGWQRVQVVTDHGWLLVPDGLPKVDLPEHLTEVRKGRCARLKHGALTDMDTVPWYWDSNVRVAVAPGIACFEAGKEYEHGGVSAQECVTPVLTVTSGAVGAVQIASIHWRGFRCTVAVTGLSAGLSVDLRKAPNDSGSSLLGAARAIEADGQVSFPVADDSTEGSEAFLVVVGADGRVQAQRKIVVGGG